MLFCLLIIWALSLSAVPAPPLIGLTDLTRPSVIARATQSSPRDGVAGEYALSKWQTSATEVFGTVKLTSQTAHPYGRDIAQLKLLVEHQPSEAKCFRYLQVR